MFGPCCPALAAAIAVGTVLYRRRRGLNCSQKCLVFEYRELLAAGDSIREAIFNAIRTYAYTADPRPLRRDFETVRELIAIRQATGISDDTPITGQHV